MFKDIKIRWGETLTFLVEIDDEQAQTATLIVASNPQVTKTADFIDGVADISLEPTETEITPGKYEYQINIQYSNGVLSKLPDNTSCSDCSSPVIIIEEALDMPGIS